MRKQSFQKVLALILVFCICMGSVNIRASAEEKEEEGQELLSVSGNNASIEEIYSDETLTKENWDNSTKETTYEGEFYRVIFKLMDIWSDGYNATVRIENTGNDIIENWMLKFDFQGAVTSIWNAVMIEQNQEGYLVKNAVWNQDIEVGKSVEFGICGEGNFSGFPKEYELIGNLKDVPAEDYTITYQLKND